MKLFAPIHSCFLVSSLTPPESFIARGELAVELAENMDTAAEVASVGGRVQGFPGQGFDLQELAFVFFRTVHGDDYGAAVVADAFWLEACAVECSFDDGDLLGVGESWQGRVLSQTLPALGGVVEKRLEGGVGLALHVAVDVPEVDYGCRGHPVACAEKLLHSEGVLDACSRDERDPHNLHTLGSELY